MSTVCRVVIVGRPNVGKSTLFNRLIGRRRALVHNLPGVTRDRIEERTQWWTKGGPLEVLMTDTGGIGGDRFSGEIQIQATYAMKNADVILFVLDSQAGLTPFDHDLHREFQKSGVLLNVPMIAVVNKVDDEIHEARSSEFFKLGIQPLLTVSSEHGRGCDDLKQAIAEVFQNSTEVEPVESLDEPTATQKRIPRIAIVGRPNVGKSTLLNALLKENRVITSSIPGTTVDSVDARVELNGKPYILVDTAGVRRKSKTDQGVEVLSVIQTRKAIESADIAVLVLDGESGIVDQDEKIGGMIQELGCCVVLAVNKWDLQRRNPQFTREMAAERVRKQMGYLNYAPILFTSGLRNQGLDHLGELFEEILHQRSLKLLTHEFTEWVRKQITVHNPMNAKFYLCHQTSRKPPTFVCHVNDPEKVHFSLRRHLVNALRERWGYMGSPVKMLFIEGKNRRSLPKPKKGAPKKKVPLKAKGKAQPHSQPKITH